MSRRVAILIANDRYSDTRFANPSAPVDEARDLQTLLEDPEVGAFDQVELVDNEWSSCSTAATAARTARGAIGRAFRPGSPPGEAVVLDLAGPAVHVTIVDRAGSGKSTLLRTLI